MVFALQRPESMHVVPSSSKEHGEVSSTAMVTIYSTIDAPAGGISRKLNSSLRLVENGLKEAGILYRATASSNGAGTKGTFKRQIPPILDKNSTKNINKIVPELVLMGTHLTILRGATA